MNDDFNIDLVFDELEAGAVWETDSPSLSKKKKKIKQELNESRVKALDRKATALLSVLKPMDGITIDPKQWLALPANVQSMYNIGRSGKFISILN